MKTDIELMVLAIRNLKPTAEFVITENDYSTIEWHVLDGTAPTKAQVNAEIEKVKIQLETAETELAASKAALLDRLGITADEAKLLLS